LGAAGRASALAGGRWSRRAAGAGVGAGFGATALAAAFIAGFAAGLAEGFDGTGFLLVGKGFP
jgi:hypothetical protein